MRKGAMFLAGGALFLCLVAYGLGMSGIVAFGKPGPGLSQAAAGKTTAAGRSSALEPGSSQGEASEEVETTLMQELQRRRTILEDREKALSQREQELAALEAEVEKKIQRLTQLQEELKGLLSQQQSQREGKLLHLVKLYEAMRPEEAASLLNGLDETLAVGLLSRMNKKKAGKVLAMVNPQRASQLSEKLAK